MIERLFKEFIMLNQKSSYYNCSSNLKDINLGNNIILRKNGYYKVLYMTSGTSIEFPETLINVLTHFYKLNGNRILKSDINNSTSIEKFIYNMILFIDRIETNKLDNILSVIVDICEIGSFEFSDWCRKELDENFGHIKFKSLTRYLDI